MARVGTSRSLAEKAATYPVRAVSPRAAKALRASNRPWSFLALLQLTNQAALRRELGLPRAHALVFDLADRIAEALGDGDIGVSVVGRWTIEIEALIDDTAVATRMAETVTALFADPLEIDGEHHVVDAAIGVVTGPSGEVDEVRMAEEAEDAMILSRSDHATILRDLSRSDPAIDRSTLRRELRRAIDQGAMFLQYQPKVNVRRQQIASAEALIRWRHPTRGVILPAEFIPLAESTRDIDRLSIWTIEQVIADQRRLRAAGHDLTIFVNISGQLLSDSRFVNRVCEIVAAADVQLGFEITETSVIRDPVSAIANLKIFAAHGIAIAIDDYGAGLSSLAYLKQLPARELKIDKMFVLQLTSSNRDPLIVRSTIDLAHALEMEVTAEGVETPAALALLSVMGCDMIQGYLISRPIEVDAFLHFLEDHKDDALVDSARESFRVGAFRRLA